MKVKRGIILLEDLKVSAETPEAFKKWSPKYIFYV